MTDVPEHPYGDGAPPVARASPPDNGAAFFMPPVLEWSSKKMAYSQLPTQEQRRSRAVCNVAVISLMTA